MDKDLHNLDDLFRSVIEPHEEDPAPEIWQGLDAMLDKQEMDQLRKKFSTYKKIAAVIIFMLLSHTLYDLAILHDKLGINADAAHFNNDTVGNAERNNTAKQVTGNRTAAKNIFPVGEGGKVKNDLAHLKLPVEKSIKLSGKMQPVNYDVMHDEHNKITSDGLLKLLNDSITNLSALAKIDSNKTIGPNEKDSLNIADITNSQTGIKKENIVNKKFAPYLTLAPLVSTEMAMYNLENNIEQNTSNNQSEDFRNEIEHRENQEVSIAAGVMITYQFKPDMGVQAGLMYSKSAISIDPHNIYASKQPNGGLAYKYDASSGYAYLNPSFGSPVNIGDSIATSDAQHNLEYLSIPLMLKYKLNLKKFYFSPSIGLSANILLASKIQTEIKDASNTEKVNITKLQGLKRVYAGYMVNTELGYNLTNQWAVSIQPYFRYAITPINNTNIVKTYPYSIGLGIGISYRF